MIEFFHSLQVEKENITRNTKKCLKELYDVLITPLPLEKINFSESPISKKFESDFISREVSTFIESTKGKHFQYDVLQDGRHIFIHFVLYGKFIRKKYDDYVKNILILLHTLNHFSSKSCLKSKEFHIYLYMTPFKKLIPEDDHPINANSVNTGVNTKDVVCSSTSHEHTNEIIIYREEDWFKVLIHESIHSFRLDFPHSGKELLLLFRVKSEVNLFESYTEFWAEIINMMFCAIEMDKTNNFDKVIEIMNLMIRVEKQFTLFQAVKILNHMDLTYETMIKGDCQSYKEESNVLAYFILKMCLMHHYNAFIGSCKANCHNIINFDESKLHILVDFIKSCYKNSVFLKDIRKMEEIFHTVKKNELLKTTKMTLFELI